MRFIGIDLHTNQITVCYRDESGNCTNQMFLLSNLDQFKSSLTKEDHVAFEATGNSNFLYRELKGLVAEIKIVNTKKFKVITRSCSKTDKNDAYTLAEFLSKDILPISRIKNETYEDIGSILDSRERLVTSRTSLKNKITNLLNRKGIKLSKASLNSDKKMNSLLNLKFGEIAHAELEFLINEVKHLNQQISNVNILIENHANKLHGYENVISIKGIGTNTAVALLCCIGNVKDFVDIKKLASYVGLAPWVNNSNETVRHGRITKNGNSLVRKMLINCAFVSVKYNPILKGFYSRLKDKKGFGKAIVATARKLLAVVYATLVNGWYFTDFCANKREIRQINWDLAF